MDDDWRHAFAEESPSHPPIVRARSTWNIVRDLLRAYPIVVDPAGDTPILHLDLDDPHLPAAQTPLR